MAKYEVKAFPLYTKDHTWVQKTADGYKVGITDYAQQKLGAIVYADLPGEDDDLTRGSAFGTVESSKAVSDLIAPVTGKVVEVNEEVLDDPSVINSSPFDTGWLLTVEPEDYEADKQELLNAEAYKAYLATLE